MGATALVITEATTLEELIAEALRLRGISSELEAARKTIDKDRKALGYLIIDKMQAAGIQRTGTELANVSISVQKHATVADWDEVYNYIRENDAFHLLHKRLSSTSAAEIAEIDGSMPGVDFYEEPTLNLRAR